MLKVQALSAFVCLNLYIHYMVLQLHVSVAEVLWPEEPTCIHCRHIEPKLQPGSTTPKGPKDPIIRYSVLGCRLGFWRVYDY